MGMFRKSSKEDIICRQGSEKKDLIRNVIWTKFRELGPMNLSEIVVMVLFLVCVLGWLLRSPQIFTGWADAYGPG